MKRLRATLVVSSAAVLVASGLGLAAVPAEAAATPCWNDVPADLDGGGPDVVVGLPSYDLPGKVDAGAIVVFSNVAAFGSADPKAPTARTLLTATDFGLTAQAGARFGAAVTLWGDAGDFEDADDCSDLLVGAPGTTVAGQVGAGRVYLLHGSPTGLGSVTKTFDEGNLVGAGGPEAGDEFGASIAADTWSSIAIGAPGRDVREIPNSGRVLHLTWQNPATEPTVQLVEQDFGEDENAEPGDRFGEVLALMGSGGGDILVVGVPHEDVGATVDAGAVEVFSPTLDVVSMMTQNRKGAGGTAETGDLYGSSVDPYWTVLPQPPELVAVGMLAIGVPGEDLGAAKDAGAVAFARFDLITLDPTMEISALKGRSEVITQDSPGIPGVVETGDRYGSGVLTDEFGQDNGREHLLVSAPLEDVGAAKDAGGLSMTRFEKDASPTTGAHPTSWTQDSPGTPGGAETGDRFGGSVSTVLLTDYENDDDSIWPVVLTTAGREDVDGVTDAGLAYLGYPPGAVAVQLKLPVLQTGAGIGMVAMTEFRDG